ncbi:MAG: nodulation protein NodJ [Gammaproteobacteria bacterium RIFCSPLOWO2_02_FULL_61_13]|nr:MAG: nodulation protein NodJ [Gammaproteobacteria bacterium RIFCSPLOWO2_02_FULL_61_13]
MNHGLILLRSANWSLPRPAWTALAVWRRNFLVWRKLLGPSLLFNFGEPLLYLLGLGYGLGRFIGEVEGLTYIAFLATGLLASSSMNTSTFEGLYSVYTRMVPQQTYDGMLATPVDVDDIVLGEMMWCATKGLISSTAILIVALGLGAIEGWQPLLCLPAFFLTGLCFAGPALVVSAISRSYDFFAYYVTLVITPMYIFGGVFYPITTLPDAAQSLVSMLPLTHAVALIRPLAAGHIPAEFALHVAVLAAYALLGFYFAVVLIRRRLIQ